MVDTKGNGWDKGWAEPILRVGRDASTSGAGDDMADPDRGGGQGSDAGGSPNPNTDPPGEWMADAGEPGLPDPERYGLPGSRWRAEGGTSLEFRRPLLFPPPPSDRSAWADVLAADWTRAPALSRRSAKNAALDLAAMVPADAASAIQRETRGMEIGEVLGALAREAPEVVGKAEAIARFRGVADGLAARARILRLLGNGVVPLEAAHAWRTLAAAHGLLPLDMEAWARRP